MKLKAPAVVLCLLVAFPAWGKQAVAPSHRDVSYGPHKAQAVDVYLPKSDKPTPAMIQIHGGGWRAGSKQHVPSFLKQAVSEGWLAVVSVEYRFTNVAVHPAQTNDCLRAIQFVRSKAKEWNIDATRIGATGGSAGGHLTMFVATHDDLADPNSDDPIARESTRPYCVAVRGPQTSLDPAQMREWTPNSRYGGHAFGKESFEQFYEDRESILPWIAEYSPIALVNATAPPACLFYGAAPAIGQEQNDPTHTANFGLKLQECCHEIGVVCDLVYPGAPDITHESPTDYLISALKAPGETT